MECVIKSPYELSVWEDIPTVEYYDNNGVLIDAFYNKKIIEVGEQTITIAGGNNFLNQLQETEDCHAVRYMDETKSAIIGSDQMNSPIKAYNLVLKQNVNGTVNLSFDMNRKYYDEEKRTFEWNPFSNLIINEQKLKLKYKNKWYDLIIKSVSESSDKEIMKVSADSLPITELSKAGYNLEFDLALKNNIGTITELANTIVEGTDWSVRPVGFEDGDSDLLEECLEEALYEVYLRKNVYAVNVRDSSDRILIRAKPSSRKLVYAFYSSLIDIKNNHREEPGKLQILYSPTNDYEVDENNVIVVSNNHNVNKQYYIETDLVWWEDPNIGKGNKQGLLPYDKKEAMDTKPDIGYYVAIEDTVQMSEYSDIWPSYIYRGEKLVHNSCQIYEPISKKVCTLYNGYSSSSLTTTDPIYKYTETHYDTDDIIRNYIGDGNTFTNVNGWSSQTDAKLTYTFWPDYNTSQFNSWNLHAYLKTNKEDDKIKVNTSVNSAIGSLEEGLTVGKTMCLRVSLGFANGTSKPKSSSVDSDDFIAYLCDYKYDKDGYPTIEGGTKYCTFNSFTKYGPTNIDGFDMELKNSQEKTPQANTDYYIYNGIKYTLADVSGGFTPGIDYYVTTTTAPYYLATCKVSTGLSQYQINNRVRSNKEGTWYLGLAIKSKTSEHDVYIEGIELFDFYPSEDDSTKPALIGTIPTGKAISVDKYFWLPVDEKGKARALDESYMNYIEKENIINALVPKERQYPFEKVRSITGKESNRFNLLQSLCETFECWLRFNIFRDENTGKIELINVIGEDGYPVQKRQYKELVFKKVVGEYNYRGFYYGTNLKDIKRDVDSSAMVSKLIVGINSNEFGQNGFCTIQRADYNPTKETFVLNLDYYVKQGMLSQTDYLMDLYTSFDGHLNYFQQLNNWQADNEEKLLQYSRLSAALTQLQGSQKTYDTAVNSAIEGQNETMEDMQYLAGTTTIKATLAKFREYAASDTYDDTKVTQSTAKSYLEKYATYEYNHNLYTKLLAKAEKDMPKLKEQILDILNEIEEETALKDELNNKFYKKYSRFIREGSWIDESYYDDNLYYMDATNVLYDSAYPQVKYTISVLDLDELFGYENYHYNLGDITYVEDVEFFGYIEKDGLKTPYQEEVLISETVDYIEEPEKNTITIQNYKTQFEDLFQKITATTQSLQYASGAYNRTTSLINLDGTINEQMLSSSLQNILAKISNAVDQSTQLSEDGVISINKKNLNYQLKIQNGALYTTSNNAKTWDEIINPEGISANKITAGKIDTTEITIYSGDQPSFKWDGSKIIAYDLTGGGGPTESYAAFNYEGLKVSQNNSARVKAGKLGDNEYGFALFDKNGNRTLSADADSGDLTITGHLSALSISTNSGLFTVDEDGVLTAKEGNFEIGNINDCNIDSCDIEDCDIIQCRIKKGTIKEADISLGTIDQAKITNCDIDSAQIKNLTFDKITGGSNSSNLIASNLTVNGGKIGGWYIDSSHIMNANSLSSASIYLDSSASGTQSSFLVRDGSNNKFSIQANGTIVSHGNIRLGEGGSFIGGSISSNAYDECCFGVLADNSNPKIAIGSSNFASSTQGGPGPSSTGILKSYNKNLNWTSGNTDGSTFTWSPNSFYYGESQVVLIDNIGLVFINGIYTGWAKKP